MLSIEKFEAYREFANKLAPLAEKSKKPFLLAVDGRTCSGKSTFADMLAREAAAAIIHTDDFFMPRAQRNPADNTPAAHMDLKRLLEETLIPAAQGKSFEVKAYDCAADIFLQPVKAEPAQFIIIEGSYACHPLLAPYYDYKLFMTVAANVQEARVFKRGGPLKLRAFKEIWIPAEEAYFAAFNTEKEADYIMDTSYIW